MGWTNSKIFSTFITSALNDAVAYNIDSDTINAALFNDTITPDQTIALANSAYGAGVWAGGGVTDTGTSAPDGWPSIGRPLGTISSDFSTNVYKYDAADTASANAVTTLAANYGCLVYNDTLAANYGMCFNYFGGSQSVTLGTFTIVWNASDGIFKITL